jgi:beta-glucosidase-like glycosyl hydrolase
VRLQLHQRPARLRQRVPAAGQLRGWWNFQGYVVSDCGAVIDIYNGHHFNAYPA